jgi:hypothetical protein
MKKIVLSLAGVLAATAFAPEASAVPAFARQTGLACSSCHFQHFPVLGTTGMEFKAGAYTQLSAKGKFKSEELSIPDNLNAAILLKTMYRKTNGNVPATEISGTTTNSGQWRLPDELALFFGGRIAENDLTKVGFIMENALAGGAVGGTLAGLKVPVVVTALDAVSISLIPFTTDTLGVAYGYDESSTGIVRGVRWSEHHAETSAARYAGIATGAAAGVAFVVKTDFGYLNYSRWSPNFGMLAGTSGTQLSSSWLRVSATPEIAGWATQIGFGVAGGTNYCTQTIANGAATAPVATDACQTQGNVIDMQAQGELAGMETSFYLQNATAKKTTAPGVVSNYFGGSANNDKKATTIGIDVSVIPHHLHVGAALRKGKTNAANSQKDDATTLQAIYDLYQNVALHAVYSKYSGPAYDVAGASNSMVTLMLEAAW